MEGNVEPVFFRGQIVGHIRKYDNRLRIELLRAHMPGKFKTPGTHTPPVISGGNNQDVVIDAATRDELVRLRREALDAMALKMNLASNEARLPDSGNSSEAAQP